DISPLRLIEDVETFHAEFELMGFPQTKALGQCHIPVVDSRCSQNTRRGVAPGRKSRFGKAAGVEIFKSVTRRAVEITTGDAIGELAANTGTAVVCAENSTRRTRGKLCDATQSPTTQNGIGHTADWTKPPLPYRDPVGPGTYEARRRREIASSPPDIVIGIVVVAGVVGAIAPVAG